MILGEEFSVSLINIMIDMHHLKMLFIKLEKFPSVLIFLRVVTMNDYWNLSSDCSVLIDIIMYFFLFCLLIWWITLIDFQMLNQLCILGEKNPTYTWYVICSIHFWIQFANILEIFMTRFMRDMCLYFSFVFFLSSTDISY